LITPRDSRVDRPLPFGEIASTDIREVGMTLEPVQQVIRGQHLQPGSRQLEGQRQSIESPADRGHGRSIRRSESKRRLHFPNAFEKQTNSWNSREIDRRHPGGIGLQCERLDGIQALAANPKCCAARGEDPERPARSGEVGDERRGVQHLLAVVEHEKGGSPLSAHSLNVAWQVDRGVIRQTESLCNCRRYERRLSNGRQLHKDDASRIVFRDLMGNFKSQTGLANSAGTDQSNQSHGRIGEPLLQELDIALATEQGGWRKRQRSRTRCVDCHIGSGSPRAGDERVTSLTL
jgi:hypothetical protein